MISCRFPSFLFSLVGNLNSNFEHRMIPPMMHVLFPQAHRKRFMFRFVLCFVLSYIHELIDISEFHLLSDKNAFRWKRETRGRA